MAIDVANLQPIVEDYEMAVTGHTDLGRTAKALDQMIIEKLNGKVGGSGGAAQLLRMKRTSLYTRDYLKKNIDTRAVAKL